MHLLRLKVFEYRLLLNKIQTFISNVITSYNI